MPRPTVCAEDWNARLEAVQLSKDDLNALVANYLFTEGYRDAAENFSREAGLSPSIDLDSIESRMEIRRAVQSGDVVAATEMVNELDPDILDTNPTLHFHLLQLQLIELIRNGKIPEAILFAQNELAPRGEEFPQFLKELEKTMTLLAFEIPRMLNLPQPSDVPTAVSSTLSTPSEADKGKSKIAPVVVMPAAISTLLEPSQRVNTAIELNEAILLSQSHGREAKLPSLLKILAWGQGMLEEKGDFPKWDFRELLEKPKATATNEYDSIILDSDF